jgi:molybdopterin synthase sulfur carrier subunit
MAIKVKLIGALRHFSQKTQLNINSQDGMSVQRLIDQITTEVPTLKSSLTSQQPSESKANSLILVNGKEISVLSGLETRLCDGDEVVFIPIIHGG